MGCDIHLHFEHYVHPVAALPPEDGEIDFLTFTSQPGGWASSEAWEERYYGEDNSEGPYWQKTESLSRPEGHTYDDYLDGRDYRLFGLLTGGAVRNHSELPSVLSCDLPEDLSPEVQRSYTAWGADAHTPRSGTLAQIRAWFAAHGDAPLAFEDRVSGVELQEMQANPAQYQIGRIGEREDLGRYYSTAQLRNIEAENPRGYASIKSGSYLVLYHEPVRSVYGRWFTRLFEVMDAIRAEQNLTEDEVRLVAWFDN